MILERTDKVNLLQRRAQSWGIYQRQHKYWSEQVTSQQHHLLPIRSTWCSYGQPSKTVSDQSAWLTCTNQNLVAKHVILLSNLAEWKWWDEVNVWAFFTVALISFGKCKEDFPSLYGPLCSLHFPTVLHMPFHPIIREVVFRNKTKCMLTWRQSKSLQREEWRETDRIRPLGAGSRS